MTRKVSLGEKRRQAYKAQKNFARIKREQAKRLKRMQGK